MEDIERAAIVQALLAARAAVDAALIVASGDSREDDAAADEACTHARKRDIAGFGEAEHWVCDDCGLEVRDGEIVSGPRGAQLPDEAEHHQAAPVRRADSSR